MLEQFQLPELFDIGITKENVTQHKPHPEAYLLAVQILLLIHENICNLANEYNYFRLILEYKDYFYSDEVLSRDSIAKTRFNGYQVI